MTFQNIIYIAQIGSVMFEQGLVLPTCPNITIKTVFELMKTRLQYFLSSHNIILH